MWLAAAVGLGPKKLSNNPILRVVDRLKAAEIDIKVAKIKRNILIVQFRVEYQKLWCSSGSVFDFATSVG